MGGKIENSRGDSQINPKLNWSPPSPDTTHHYCKTTSSTGNALARSTVSLTNPFRGADDDEFFVFPIARRLGLPLTSSSSEVTK
jgi:hypothetical protein